MSGKSLHLYSFAFKPLGSKTETLSCPAGPLLVHFENDLTCHLSTCRRFETRWQCTWICNQICTEERGTTFLQNTSTALQNYKTSQKTLTFINTSIDTGGIVLNKLSGSTHVSIFRQNALETAGFNPNTEDIQELTSHSWRSNACTAEMPSIYSRQTDTDSDDETQRRTNSSNS